MIFDEAVMRSGNGLGVLAEIRKITADKGKIGFCRIDALDPADPFHGLGLKDVAAQSIYSVCGINDNPSLAQQFCCLPDQSFLWVLRMYADDHNLGDGPGLVASQQLVEITLAFFGNDLI